VQWESALIFIPSDPMADVFTALHSLQLPTCFTKL